MPTTPFFFKFIIDEVNPDFPSTIEAEIHAKNDGSYGRLTPKITEAQLDEYINDFINELEQIRTEGHRKFAAAKRKQGL